MRFALILAAITALVPATIFAGDQPQWGERHTRNMVSSETGLPTDFDPATGKNIKWSAPLGSHNYASPIIANGRVLIGANNADPRDPRHSGDRGVLLCLDEEDGSLLWQLVVPRIADDRFKDWPRISICSPPVVEDGRVYAVTNRYEVVCLDIHGQANGNDGPYLDEGRHMVPEGEAPAEVTALDADILWITDMIAEVDMYPHDGSHSAILLDGPYLYLNTGNGVDNTHAVIRRPNAPTLIALEKATGRVVAVDNERIGPNIFHATWSSPAMGSVNGAAQLFFAGPNAVCYGFKPLDKKNIPRTVQPFERVWRFDCDPTAPKENIASYLKNRKVGPCNITGLPVFYKDRIYVCGGGDIWWGKEEAWLKCIDATQTGDVTETAERWSYPLEMHACSTPAIINGLVFVGDCGKLLHCVDAETGERYWTHQLKRGIWGSALAADGKVYIGSRGGDLVVFAAEKTKRLLATIDLGAPMASTPAAANGVLYVSTLERLYAVAVGAGR